MTDKDFPSVASEDHLLRITLRIPTATSHNEGGSLGPDKRRALRLVKFRLIGEISAE